MNDTIVPSTVPAAPQETPTAVPTVTPVFVEPQSHVSITAAQGAQIERDIRDDLAKGKISQAVAATRFDELNTPLDQRVAPPDTRTDEQKLIEEKNIFPRPRRTPFSFGTTPLDKSRR